MGFRYKLLSNLSNVSVCINYYSLRLVLDYILQLFFVDLCTNLKLKIKKARLVSVSVRNHAHLLSQVFIGSKSN